MDEISDVEGLYPTFVMNILPASALSIAKNNGIGNTWGLDDDQSYICTWLRPLLEQIFDSFYAPFKLERSDTNAQVQYGNSLPVGPILRTTCE